MARRADIQRKVLLRGPRADIVAAVTDERACPAIEFLQSLSPRDQARLFTLFTRFAEHALIQDGHKFKRLDGDVWEFKARGQDTGLRVTCYRTGRLMVLLTGFRKSEDDTDPREISHARSVMEADRRLHKEER